MKRSEESQTLTIKLPQTPRTFESYDIGNFDSGDRVIFIFDSSLNFALNAEYPDPDKMWIKKPAAPSPDAENYKSALHDLIPPIENLTDEDIERMTYDDDIVDGT